MRLLLTVHQDYSTSLQLSLRKSIVWDRVCIFSFAVLVNALFCDRCFQIQKDPQVVQQTGDEQPYILQLA